MISINQQFRQIPESADQVIVSVNPKAGSGTSASLVDSLVDLLSRRDYVVSVVSEVDEVSRRAEQFQQAGALRAVVSAGGDGTAALIVNRTQPGTPIAILPLGTENLLSKYLGITAEPEKICDTIAGGRIAQLDAGLANGQIFLLMGGCGFDAEVVRRLHNERTGNIHHLSYFKPIFESIRNYQYPKLRIYSIVDGQSQPVEPTVSAKWVFVVNLPRYAGGLQIVPDADGADSLLDVCTFKGGSFCKGLIYLGGVLMGRHRNWSDCVTFQTQHVRIESDEPVPYQLDGDPGGFLPVEIGILPGRLSVLVPEKWAGSGRA